VPTFRSLFSKPFPAPYCFEAPLLLGDVFSNLSLASFFFFGESHHFEPLAFPASSQLCLFFPIIFRTTNSLHLFWHYYGARFLLKADGTLLVPCIMYSQAGLLYPFWTPPLAQKTPGFLHPPFPLCAKDPFLTSARAAHAGPSSPSPR